MPPLGEESSKDKKKIADFKAGKRVSARTARRAAQQAHRRDLIARSKKGKR